MIQINLSTAKKPINLTALGGLDLSKINVKFMLLAILLVYVPDFTLYETWDSDKKQVEERYEAVRAEKKRLSSEVDTLKDFDRQIQALQRQEQKLKERLEVVKAILSKRQNPWEVLVYIAKNIPNELWLTEASYNNKKIVFKGLSIDYTPQGVFLDNIKKSIFFDKNVTYNKSEPAGGADAKNLAPFEISASIAGAGQ